MLLRKKMYKSGPVLLIQDSSSFIGVMLLHGLADLSPVHLVGIKRFWD